MTKTVKIVGLQKYDTKMNNQDYKGVVIHCIFEDQYVTGTGVISFSVSEFKMKDLPNFKIGDEFKAVYTKNQYRKNVLECLL